MKRMKKDDINRNSQKKTITPIRSQIINALDPKLTYLIFEKAKGLNPDIFQNDLRLVLDSFEDIILSQDIYGEKQDDVWICVVKMAGENHTNLIDHVFKHLHSDRISCTVYNRQEISR